MFGAIGAGGAAAEAANGLGLAAGSPSTGAGGGGLAGGAKDERIIASLRSATILSS